MEIFYIQVQLIKIVIMLLVSFIFEVIIIEMMIKIIIIFIFKFVVVIIVFIIFILFFSFLVDKFEIMFIKLMTVIDVLTKVVILKSESENFNCFDDGKFRLFMVIGVMEEMIFQVG